MAVVPTGILSTPIAAAKTLLGDTAAWQTWVDEAGDAAAAKAFIYVGAKAGPLARPFAIVDIFAFALARIGGGSRDVFRATGTVGIIIEADVTESDGGDAHYEFLNELGAVLQDMRELSGSSSYLPNARISLDSLMSRSTKKQGEAADYYEALLRLEYGA